MPFWLAALVAASAAAAPAAARFSAPPVPAALALPPSIAAADPVHAPWLAAVVEEARANSPAARRVLRDVASLSAQSGQPAVVALGRTELGGELSLKDGRIKLERRHLKEPLASGATTLIHELRHWVQLRSGLPMDPLELELDAYTVDFQVASDLRDRVPKRSYDGRARAAFQRGLEPFMRFLKRNYPDDFAIRGSSLRSFEKTLSARTKDKERSRRDLAWLADRANRRRFQSYLRRLYGRAERLGSSYRIP